MAAENKKVAFYLIFEKLLIRQIKTLKMPFEAAIQKKKTYYLRHSKTFKQSGIKQMPALIEVL